MMYKNGIGVDQDYSAALDWYRGAADLGLIGSQVILGSMYKDGEGVPVDEFKTVELYREAADQGETDAQYNLGTMYANGWDVDKSYFLNRRRSCIWKPSERDLNMLWLTCKPSKRVTQLLDAFSAAEAAEVEMRDELQSYQRNQRFPDLVRKIGDHKITSSFSKRESMFHIDDIIHLLRAIQNGGIL